MWQPSFDLSNRRMRWLFCIFGGVYLNLFIVLFQPYQGDIFVYDSPLYYQFVFGGIVTAVFTLTHITLPYFFPRYFIQPYFTAARFLIWFVFSGFLCHVPTFFYDNWLNHIPNTWYWFLIYEIQYALPTLLFISIPFLTITAFLFYKGKSNESAAQQEENTSIAHEKDAENTDLDTENSASETEQTPPQYQEAKADDFIKLTDFSGKNTFEISPNQLVYITSETNYIEIFHTSEKGVLTRTLLRQTLKYVENQLVSEGSSFCRCHNEYIVNKEKIVSLRGNAKKYELILRGGNKPIPVSRNKNDKLIAQFIHLLEA